MSILQEYAKIRGVLGEEEFNAIERYLELHPELFLSDIYYTIEGYNRFKFWWDEDKKHRAYLDYVKQFYKKHMASENFEEPMGYDDFLDAMYLLVDEKERGK